MTKWIVTAVDTSETADGKARVLKVCDDKPTAIWFAQDDMEKFINDADGMDLVTDFEKLSVHTEDYQYGCEWNVEEVEIPVD